MTEVDDYVLAAADILDHQRHPDPDMREFLRMSADGRLRFQHCLRCGYVRFPAAPVCPECLSEEAEWRLDAGTATIWSYCVYHRAFSPSFRQLVPYTVCLVELDSGPRLITNPVGVAPSGVHIGQRGVVMPVRAGELSMPYFMPERDRE